MRKMVLLAGIAAAVSMTPAIADNGSAGSAVSVSTGKNLYDSAGKRVGAIYRVTADGNPQVILNGHLVTVPASTLSDPNGEITTSLSRAELSRAR